MRSCAYSKTFPCPTRQFKAPGTRRSGVPRSARSVGADGCLEQLVLDMAVQTHANEHSNLGRARMFGPEQGRANAPWCEKSDARSQTDLIRQSVVMEFRCPLCPQ
jgi:hypothetical protein